MDIFKTAAAAAALGAMSFTPALADHHKEQGMAKGKNIVATAQTNDDFETLVTAVKSAQLVDDLSGPGPFTVFAPTDAAFATLPDGTLDQLTMRENREQLQSILTYHVLAGDYSAADIVGAVESNGGSASFETLNGKQVTASIVDGDLYLGDHQGNAIKVVMADVETSNGTIHAIEGVLMP